MSFFRTRYLIKTLKTYRIKINRSFFINNLYIQNNVRTFVRNNKTKTKDMKNRSVEKQIGTFPEDFASIPHFTEGAKQWIITKPSGVKISIVGGGYGLYGDGVSTFEMWDYDEENPRPYQTIKQVNNHLKSFII